MPNKWIRVWHEIQQVGGLDPNCKWCEVPYHKTFGTDEAFYDRQVPDTGPGSILCRNKIVKEIMES